MGNRRGAQLRDTGSGSTARRARVHAAAYAAVGGRASLAGESWSRSSPRAGLR